MPIRRELAENDYRAPRMWHPEEVWAPQLLVRFLSTLRLQADASAACLWVQTEAGMRLYAADPGDLPLGEVLPAPGGIITEAADDGALRLVPDPFNGEGLHQIPLMENRIRSAAVALLPVGDGPPPLPGVVSLHLPLIPDDATQRLFEWARWSHLVDAFLPADAGGDNSASAPAHSIHSNHLAGLKTVAGGLAHRVNERLSTVAAALQQAHKLLGSKDPALRFLRYVEEELDRATELLAKLLAYGGNEALIAETVNLADCAAEAVRRLEPERPPQVRLTAVIPAGFSTIVADRVQVVTAIMEVVRNALEATPNGTEVTLELEQEEDGILITVNDEGVGMTQEVLERATQPFFSSKHPEDHLGLGLSTTQGCIHRCGGRMSISSQVGAGTRVKMWFPSQAHPPVA